MTITTHTQHEHHNTYNTAQTINANNILQPTIQHQTTNTQCIHQLPKTTTHNNNAFESTMQIHSS